MSQNCPLAILAGTTASFMAKMRPPTRRCRSLKTRRASRSVSPASGQRPEWRLSSARPACCASCWAGHPCAEHGRNARRGHRAAHLVRPAAEPDGPTGCSSRSRSSDGRLKLRNMLMVRRSPLPWPVRRDRRGCSRGASSRAWNRARGVFGLVWVVLRRSVCVGTFASFWFSAIIVSSAADRPRRPHRQFVKRTQAGNPAGTH